MSKIFISSFSHDNANALVVAQWLEEKGWGKPFLDICPDHGLTPVRRWREELAAAAGRCEAVICSLLSFVENFHSRVTRTNRLSE